MPPPRREDLWSQGQDETVEVNQRALIDKILARYSGEHTIFRELLQNADDAGAEHVQVRFYTQARLDALDAAKEGDKGEGPSRLPDAKRDNIARCVVMNDGIPFRGQDWQRLKKIAEGNPDEEKIGAFGVGFYSLWSVCDDPFVESGGKWMGFYWKDGKDQLLARSGDLPPDSSHRSEPSSTGHPWTSFTLDLRDPSPLEGPLDLARFFVTSLTFMRTMRKIDMLVDDVRVFRVCKSVKERNRVVKRGLNTRSAQGMMSVSGVDATGMTITAEVMEWLAATGFVPPPLPTPAAIVNKGSKTLASFFSSFRSSPSPAPTPPPPPPQVETKQPTNTTVLAREVHTYQAEIKVSVTSAFGRELERATKKPPPKTMPASLVFSREDEGVALQSESGKARHDAGDVFGGLCPPLDGDKSAKVFIGQATSQTTGIGGHLAARFIPTVERESIDLVDKHVSQWNKELLWVGGYLSRLIYELEMQEIQTLWSTTSVSDKAVRDRLLARGLHALRFFTFKPSTPSAVVSQELESAFYACATDNKSLPLVSNVGILPIDKVKLPDPVLQKFLPDLPTVTPDTSTSGSRAIARLQERRLLRPVVLDDVIDQLGQRPLTEKEMVDCLQWWQSVGSVDGYTTAVRARLLDAAILLLDTGKVVPLSTIQTFVKPQSSSIPTDMPLPGHTLPYTVTKELRGNTIYQIFGWTELTTVQYITFLCGSAMSGASGVNPETDIRTSPIFAEKVLSMLGRAWQSISANQQSAIALELKDVECIPTKAGFKKPGDAYFEKNLLFDDLPTIALPKTPTIKGGMEKMLLAIGVRKTVNLQLVFSRLIGGGTWTCQDLVRYLVSVKDTLTSEEMGRLKHTAAFPKEQPLAADGSKPPVVRLKPLQLYEPVDALRELGLPILDWGEGKWKPSSDEARLLFTLGLCRYPSVEELLKIAAGPAPTNKKALEYLISKLDSHYVGFDPKNYANYAFLPATLSSGETTLVKPGEVFTNWNCAILGFAVVDISISSPETCAKLRIPSDPSMEQLVTAFMSHVVKDLEKAKLIFQYMATQIGHAPSSSYGRLQNVAFVPVKTARDIQLYKPSEVYFAKQEATNELYGSAFTFVDFGESANIFLRYCGVRAEPSVKDIAWLLVREPERTLQQAGSKERYLQQLRLLAANWSNFDNSTKMAMARAPFVLASQHVAKAKSSGAKNWLSGKMAESAMEEYEVEWVLCRATDVALIDNPTLVQYFGKHILAGPEEELLENLYLNLGARWISSMTKTESLTSGPLAHPTPQAQALRHRALERLTIFLAEARRKQSEYSIEWLKQEGRFTVKEVRGLQVRYTLRQGKQEYSHYETLYASASRNTMKAVTLTVSVTAEPDDYDIASSLCSVLLKNPKADDALLLYSILSTPLMALKKRGFNVDRLLNQEREERLRIQAERDQQYQNRQQQSQQQHHQHQIESENAPDSDKQSIRSSMADDASSIKNEKSSSIMDQIAKKRPFSGGGNGFMGMGKMPGLLDSMPGAFNPNRSGKPAIKGAGGAGGAGPAPGHSTKEPSSMNDIRQTVQTAINMSKPSNEVSLADKSGALTDTAESESNWCDRSVQTNLSLAFDGGPGSMKLYVPNDEPDHATFLRSRLDTCQRFEQAVLQPLASIFGLRPEIVSIFWDHDGPTIAFNRDGALFCNARYFSAWHDEQVRRGDTNEAFISWYMSLAHELAHNLESAHNSRHEFHFSSIAEMYLVKLSALIRQ